MVIEYRSSFWDDFHAQRERAVSPGFLKGGMLILVLAPTVVAVLLQLARAPAVEAWRLAFGLIVIIAVGLTIGTLTLAVLGALLLTFLVLMGRRAGGLDSTRVVLDETGIQIASSKIAVVFDWTLVLEFHPTRRNLRFRTPAGWNAIPKNAFAAPGQLDEAIALFELHHGRTTDAQVRNPIAPPTHAYAPPIENDPTHPTQTSPERRSDVLARFSYEVTTVSLWRRLRWVAIYRPVFSTLWGVAVALSMLGVIYIWGVAAGAILALVIVLLSVVTKFVRWAQPRPFVFDLSEEMVRLTYLGSGLVFSWASIPRGHEERDGVVLQIWGNPFFLPAAATSVPHEWPAARELVAQQLGSRFRRLAQ